ncbi:hypothetical protein B0A50_04286 [Salinomyces thailandicus]|uniref:Uncharacterized protein n=1 Tax=Salinomyces thailandicus TaxID=706561 RepID=A0A4U0TWP9_9PEZI|nr:hypothetical protein B0A50_04286 [Salinomyces thailandica]
MHIRQDTGQEYQYYHYVPSIAAAIVFAILFGASTAMHTYQMFKTKTWFLVPFLIGGIFETIGYIARSVSHTEAPDYTLGPYIVQTILLLVAPALFAASIYMTLGRIVLMLDAQSALFIRRTWLTKIFVCGDVFSFLIQAGGGGLLASGDVNTVDTGNSMVVGGLFIQIVFFGLFVTAAAIFHSRTTRMPTQRCHDLPFWRKQMVCLHVVSTLILVRSIVRVVEFLQGDNGFVVSHEVFLYVFDALVMFIAVALMNWVHPGQVAVEIRRRRGNGLKPEETCKAGLRMDGACDATVEDVRQPDDALPASQDEWLQDMQLMHHYSTHVAHTSLGVREHIMYLWRDVIPQEALRHPFLLHGLLAMSAMSLAYLRPDETDKFVTSRFSHNAMPETEEPNVRLPAAVRSRFDALDEMLKLHCSRDSYDHCLAALQELADIYRNVRYFVALRELESGQVIRWMVMVPTQYVRLIQARHAPALVILAHFAAAIASTNSVWYLDGWAQCCLQGIRLALDHDMQKWLDWPQEQTDHQLAAVHAED